MQKLTIVCMVVFSIQGITGCSMSKPEFNPAYLPRSVPGKPLKKIDVTKVIANNMSSRSWGLFSKNTKASLYWAEKNALLLNISYENTSTLLSSFLIAPGTGEIKLLEAVERDAFLATKNRSASVSDAETLTGSIAKTTKQLIAFLLSAGRHEGSFTDSYIGKLENNGFILDIAFTVNKRGGGMFQSVYYDCNYVITRNQTEYIHESKVRIDKEVEDGKIRKLESSLQEWLQSWRIAPDGRAYFITKTATIVTPGRKDEKKLIENYAYTGLDIDPDWNQLAVFMMSKDEKTKQINSWVEFYSIEYKGIPRELAQNANQRVATNAQPKCASPEFMCRIQPEDYTSVGNSSCAIVGVDCSWSPF